MYIGYFKNRTPEARERNYLEFVFKKAFSSLLLRKRNWNELVNLEQGETYKLEFYQAVYVKLYKLTTKVDPIFKVSGGVYNADKDIYYFFILSKTRDDVFTLNIEIAAHRYIPISDNISYTGESFKEIYQLFEEDALTWS